MLNFLKSVLEIAIEYGPSLLLGVRTTIIIAIIGTICGLLIGLIVGGFKAIKLDYNASPLTRFLKKLGDILIDIYITVFRVTPMMVQAVFFYYAFLNILRWDKLTAAMVVISINTGAYMAEIIRSGVQAVDKGQTEAARSLGLSNAQTMMMVVLPQAITNAFPAIGNELIVNIKDSSVLMIISVTELMFQAKSIAGSTFRFTETYFLEASIYLAINMLATFILNKIEEQLNKTEHVSIPLSDTNPKSMAIVKGPKQKG